MIMQKFDRLLGRYRCRRGGVLPSGSYSGLADALVAAFHNNYRGWGEVAVLAACTAARIGEISGCRVGDIDTTQWIWTVRRQTTPAPAD
jgi:hypothetical protein